MIHLYNSSIVAGILIDVCVGSWIIVGCWWD
jgi:hypothetical protein